MLILTLNPAFRPGYVQIDIFNSWSTETGEDESYDLAPFRQKNVGGMAFMKSMPLAQMPQSRREMTLVLPAQFYAQRASFMCNAPEAGDSGMHPKLPVMVCVIGANLERG